VYRKPENLIGLRKALLLLHPMFLQNGLSDLMSYTNYKTVPRQARVLKQTVL